MRIWLAKNERTKVLDAAEVSRSAANSLVAKAVLWQVRQSAQP
jgi:hypothetical protein